MARPERPLHISPGLICLAPSAHIGYTFAPEVEHYVAGKYLHIHMVKTYEVEMKAQKLKLISG